MFDPRTGKVIVNASQPVSMADFASIYGNAASPQDAARDLWFNAPTAGRSYLEDQWSHLGIKQSPEDYFSNPANLAAASAAGHSAGTSVSPSVNATPQWPSFRNDAERNLAVDSGQYDPAYPTPRAMQIAQAQKIADDSSMLKTASLAAEDNPIDPRYDKTGKLSNPNAVLTGQLAGDTSGGVTQVLRSIQGDPTNSIIPPMIRRPLDPYLPSAGYGPASSNSNLSIDKLDRNIFHDPEFQKILAQDPKRASFVYQRLAGRDLAGDIKSAQSLQSDQMQTGFNYAKTAIASGAKFDPNSRSWKVWNREPPSADSLTGGQQPVAQLVDATPQQNFWLNQHYSNVMGGHLPQLPYNPPVNQHILSTALQDPDVAQEIQSQGKILNRTLSPYEMLNAAKSVAIKKAQLSPHGWIYNTAAQARNAIYGVKNIPEQDPDAVLRAAQAARGTDENQNWLGRNIFNNIPMGH